MENGWKMWINKNNYQYRLIQIIIFILHLILLRWMIFILQNAGLMPFKSVLLHFLGVAVMGAGLIRFCAWYFKRIYLQENQTHGKK